MRSPRPAALAALLLSLGAGCQRDPGTPEQRWFIGPPTALEPAAPPGQPLLQFSGARPRNVLMISIDTLRPDVLGQRGGNPHVSPVLDRLAREGVALDDLQSCSNWTVPAFYCALGGGDPVQLGFDPWLSDLTHRGGVRALPQDFPFLTGLLREAGFRTYGAFANPIVRLMPSFVDDFDHFEVLYDDDNPGFPPEQGEQLTGRARALLAQAMEEATAAPETAGDAASAPPRPWLVHLHYLDPHEPYEPTPEFSGPLDRLPPTELELSVKVDDALPDFASMRPAARGLALDHLRARYLGLVRQVDHYIGQVLEEASRLGALDDTLVVIWSDHGEQFGERNRFGHHLHLFQEERAALGLFHAPGLAPVRYPRPLGLGDLSPTIVEALGLSEHPALAAAFASWQGHVIGTEPAERAVLSTARSDEGVELALLDAESLFVYRWDGRVQLIDRRSDTAELAPQTELSPEQLAPHWARMEPLVRGYAAMSPGLEPWQEPASR